ncbi:MAG: CNNM domain-containing protein [Acidobacteria bacterium]|nr:CNNM domain-containing protein [Acidobacteriota bacterium]
MTLLVVFVSFALSVSFLCSLLEAALLSARRGMLAEKKAAGSRGAALLLAIKEERIDDAISAILILNTVANTLGATMAGAQAARVFGSSTVGIFSGILTFLILVFSEIIPKTLGALYAPRLSNLVGYTLQGLTTIMSPALTVSRMLTRLLAPNEPTKLSKGELEALIAAAAKEGAIDPAQTRLLESLMRFDTVRVSDVMTPRPVMVMMPADSTVADLLTRPETDAFSRIPLHEPDDTDEVVGYVVQREVLRAAAAGAERDGPLDAFRRPVFYLPGFIRAGAALRQLLDRREALAVVVDEHGSIEGVITLEDLTETLIGAEIVDESDRVVDLRQAALEHRDRRLARLRERRASSSNSPDSSSS